MSKRGRVRDYEDDDEEEEERYLEEEEDEPEYEAPDAEDDDDGGYQPKRKGRGAKPKKKTAKRHNAGAPAAPPPGPPPDPFEVALKQLKQVAPALSHEAAKESLEAVLAQNPGIKDTIDTWVDDAQVHAACFTEINDEAALLRDAMAESLREAEEAKKKEQEEEQRESRLSAVKRKFEDSPILSKLLGHACPALLLDSSAYEPLNKLLLMEKRSKKWYSGRGTYYYFEQLAVQLRDSLMQLAGVEAAGKCTSSNGGGAKKVQAWVACDVPGCASCADKVTNGGAASAAGAAALARSTKAGSSNGGPSTGAGPSSSSGAGTSAGAAAGGSDSPSKQPAWLDAFAKALQQKEQYIQEEVARMPLYDPAEAGSKLAAEAKQLTHIPLLFKLPPGLDEMEVVECFSDDDE